MNALVPTNTNDMLAIAKQMAVSGLFSDTRKAEEAFVKIMAGAEMGIAPFTAMSGIHIIQGKPVIGAGLMASMVKSSTKYDYRVIEHSDKLCSIDFYQGAEKIGNSSLTIEEAKKAGVKNLDKYPKNMLFARAMSNGVKFYTPDIFNGPIYTEGEIEPREVQETTAEVIPEPAPAKKSPDELMREFGKLIDGVTTIEEIKGVADQMRNAKLGPQLGPQLGNTLVLKAFTLGFELADSEEVDAKGKPVKVWQAIASTTEEYATAEPLS